MEIISAMWEGLDTHFRSIFALLASIFTVFFALKKIGNKVSVNYSITSEGSSHTRINDLIFQNKKDKPVSIYKIVAVFDKTYYLEIEKCSPPLILKPFESISVKTKEFSYLSVNGDRYFPDFWEPEIYIESQDKIIKCNSQAHKTKRFEFTEVLKVSNSLNGIVYDDHVTFALVYNTNGVSKTAFIYDSGVIKHEWDFYFNAIGKRGEKVSAIEICSCLNEKLANQIESYSLFRINDNTLKFEHINYYDLRDK